MRWAAIIMLCGVLAGCKHDAEEEDEDEEQRDLLWRARITIVGRGSVATANGTFSCTSDGTAQTGACGPTLVRFGELDPPLLQARDAPGWQFDHWASTIRDRRMPEGRLYMNAFGYADTGQLETVTAVFIRR